MNTTNGRKLRVLLATDGSEGASRAADFLCDWVGRQGGGCEITVLHVVRPLAYWYVPSETGMVTSGEIMAQLLETARTDGKEIVSRLVERFAGRAQASGLVAEGDPAQEIVEAARDQAADLIVMGSRGMSPIQGLLLGSVTNRVLHQAERPVLVVP